MNVILILVPLSIVLVVAAGVALIWAVDHGQFDDMDTPGLVPLTDRDDDPPSGTAEPAPRPESPTR